MALLLTNYFCEFFRDDPEEIIKVSQKSSESKPAGDEYSVGLRIHNNESLRQQRQSSQ